MVHQMIPLYLCYFTFGFALAFPGIATQFTMIEDLHFHPSSMTYAYGFIALPWCLKPVYGFISDSFPVFDWGKRRPYISAAGLLAAFLYVYIPHLITSPHQFTIMLMTISLCISFADVCADSILVEMEKKENANGSIQTTCWSYRALGTAVGALFGGFAYKALGAVAVYRICSLSPFFMSLVVWDLKRSATCSSENICSDLWKNIIEARMLVLLFFFISVSPGYGVFYTYFLKQRLHYSPTDFSWINLCSSISYLSAVLFYKKYLLDIGKVKIIFTAIFGSMVLRLAQLAVVAEKLPYFSIVLLDSVAESFCDELIIMPLIILSAQACKDGVEGTLYALLMSVSNFSGFCSAELGGYIGEIFNITETNFDNLFFYMALLIGFDFVFSCWILWKITSSSSFDSVVQKKDPINYEIDLTEEPDDPVELLYPVQAQASLELGASDCI